MMPVLHKLMKLSKSIIFSKPVDTAQHPEYTTVIQQPIDLGTIKQSLMDRSYDEPWKFVEDICRVFNNARIFNKKNTLVYSYACDV